MESNMKKNVCILFILLSVTCLFAAGKKSWKPDDILYETKFEKLLETYNLKKVNTSDVHEVYKNEETSDWLYVYHRGSEEYQDEIVYKIAFGYINGVFDSCTNYNHFTSNAETNQSQYLHAYIDESKTSISEYDYKSQTNWHWNDPSYVYVMMFVERCQLFQQVYPERDQYNLFIPDEVINRYNYFYGWLIANQTNKKITTDLPKDYKRYLKEHKER